MRLSIGLVACCAAWGASGEEFVPQLDQLPSLYAVDNIQDGSRLNVRAAPSTKSRDIGDLPKGTVVEATQFGPEAIWARIVWNDGNGWVHREFLRQVETPYFPTLGLPANLTCVGAEPSWRWQVTGGETVIFSSDNGAAEQEVVTVATPSASHATRMVIGSQNWRGFLQKKECSDGISARLYGIQLDLMGLGEGRAPLLSGCCQITPTAAQ